MPEREIPCGKTGKHVRHQCSCKWNHKPSRKPAGGSTYMERNVPPEENKRRAEWQRKHKINA